MDWAHWGNEFVLYHRPAGMTHWVNSATATLLREVLASTALDAAEAARELAQRERSELGATFIDDVRSTLERLEALGLVERIVA